MKRVKRIDKVLIKVLYSYLKVPASIIATRTGLSEGHIYRIVKEFDFGDLDERENRFVLRLLTALIENKSDLGGYSVDLPAYSGALNEENSISQEV